MTKSFSKKQISIALSCALALSVASGAARAENRSTDVGYVVDTPNRVVWNSTGGCWRTDTGPADEKRTECGLKSVAEPISKAAEPIPQRIAKAEVAPEPIPQPVAMAEAAPVRAAERLTLNADTLFDFNKSTLRPAGRAALDEFVAKTKTINPETISAIGHTDRIGSMGYNQILSEQRAQAVKDYLVSKGIDPNRIQTEGKGETQPVTHADECVGAKSAKVIACLQPDRSVDIEVVGARIATR